MTHSADLPTWAALLTSLFLLLGAVLTLIGSLGLLRLGSFYDRIHAPTLGTTLGIGSGLIRHGLAAAEAAGVDAFLETGQERNVAYYERFGFRVVDQGSPAPDGPPAIETAPTAMSGGPSPSRSPAPISGRPNESFDWPEASVASCAPPAPENTLTMDVVGGMSPGWFEAAHSGTLARLVGLAALCRRERGARPWRARVPRRPRRHQGRGDVPLAHERARVGSGRGDAAERAASGGATVVGDRDAAPV